MPHRTPRPIRRWPSLQWLKKRGFVEDAPAELKSNRDVIVATVKQNGCALRYASAALKADTELVLAAVTGD